MKTNVIMTSKDRELFGITIKQETKTGFLSISELQKAYNIAKWEYGWGEINIASLMQSNKMIERVYYILKERDFINIEFSTFTEQCKESGITKVLKNLGIWKTNGRGENRTVMCDPYIWVSIALELNPMIYARVVIWLTDSLIFDRVSAGRDYSPMNDSIKKILPNPEYYKYAIAINERVFGKHYPGMRNDASANELRTITRIEQFIISAISMNMIKNEEDILNIIKTMTI